MLRITPKKEGEKQEVLYLDEKAAKMLGDFSSSKVERRNCSLFIQKMLNPE